MINRVKLHWDEVVKINRFNKNHLRERLLCVNFLYKYEEGTNIYFRQYTRMRYLPYLIVLPFVLILEFFCCIWDGGLKTYTWQIPEIRNYTINRIDSSYQFCIEIWNKRAKGDKT